MSDAGDQNKVAVIGMAGRFPGAPDVAALWDLLRQGREGIRSFTDDELAAAGVSPELLAQPGYVRSKGVIDDADGFDAAFFGMNPREAEITDPQHRVFLETAWTALESAGCDPATFDGRIGLFAGASLNSYLLFNLMADERTARTTGAYQTLLASDKDFLATRVSYKLDLTGPSLTVQTACSTSLVAVHLACQSLLAGECDIALAGGVSVSVPLQAGYRYEAGGILSPDGHCRPFDAAAGGTVAGNGAGVVVLRRLADARAAGDRLRAVVLGTAVNNDGALKAGYTAPSVEGQTQVITEALAVADVHPDTIGYVEAHGTGTVLGDPIEVAALTRAYRARTDRTGYCALGSVKGNLGHLDAAAGVTAFIAAVLALEHEAVPPSVHYREPNPELALDRSPFVVPQQLRSWPRGGDPRRAGVSSFGIGGTNAHVVLEEAPAPAAPPPAPGRSPHLFLLSARTAPALAAAADRLADRLEATPDADPVDVALTLGRRRAFATRRAVVAPDLRAAVPALRAAASGATPPAGRPAPERPAPVAFLLPGQGSQYPDMARGLYRHEPVFTRELDACADAFAEPLGLDLRTLLFPAAPLPGEEQGSGPAADALRRTAITQPALFAVEYALAQQWMAWGVRPRALAGHSIGELVAATLAGVLAVPDAVRLVAARGRIVSETAPGAMLAVVLPEDRARSWLGDGLDLAAVNSTQLCVAAGPAPAIDELADRLRRAGVPSRRLHTSHAFHSASMEPALDRFVAECSMVRFLPPSIPFLSNVSGTWITDEQATSPRYWGEHLRRTVRFADGLSELLADPDLVLLEVGPGATLTTFARQHAAWSGERVAVGSLRQAGESGDDAELLLASFGALWAAGADVDRAAFLAERYAGVSRAPLAWPTYPFQRDRYWVDPGAARAEDRAPDVDAKDVDAAGVAGRPGDPAAVDGPRWYVPGWRRLPAVAPLPDPWTGSAGTSGATGTWVVLGAEPGPGTALVARLRGAGAAVVPVTAEPAGRPGTVVTAERAGDGSWRLDPADRAHLTELLASIPAVDGPLRLVHCWNLADDPASGSGQAAFDRLLALAQAVGDTVAPGPVVLDVLCRGVFTVTGDELLDPYQALSLGVTTVAPQEIPGLTCRILDLTGTELGDPDGDAVRRLVDLLGTVPRHRALALRGRHGWSREFDLAGRPSPGASPGGPTPPPSRWRAGGVYLVTGGLGGIGLAVAEQVARRVTSPAIGLLTRGPFPAEESWDDWLSAHDESDVTSRRIRRVRRLAAAGARVAVLVGDVTDPARMASVVAELRARFGPVNGVVHAAGRPGGGLLRARSADEVAAVLAPKVSGTLALQAACRNEPLDFLLLCSSLTAVLGGPGQVDYAAANAFLDACAQSCRTSAGPATGPAGVPVVSVAWDTWQGVGMAAGLDSLLGGPDVPVDDPDLVGEPTGHPLLRRVGPSSYTATFRTDQSWIVDEHRIQGHGLVPGTAYLELVRAAVTDQLAGRPGGPGAAAELELRDVVFLQPVIVPDGQTRRVEVALAERAGDWGFVIRSRSGRGTAPLTAEHARGTVAFLPESAEPPRDLAAERDRCAVAEVLETEDDLARRLRLDLVEAGEQVRFTFGPRWRCLRRIEAGLDRLLVTLELDQAFAGDLDGYPLHPALLDVAGAAARIRGRDVYYLPFTYRRVRIRSGLTPTLHCLVRFADSPDASGETLTCDLDLLAPDGGLLVAVEGFSIKRINDIDALVAQIDRAGRAPVPDADPGRRPQGALRELAEGMPADDALAVLDDVLAVAELPDHVVVCHRDLDAMRRLALGITPELLVREAADGMAPPAATHPRPELATPYRAATTEHERVVAEIWQQVLGIDPIGIDDDFFALGGHSLAAVQIGATIQSRLGVELDLRGFFDHPTVAGAASAVAAALAEGAPSAAGRSASAAASDADPLAHPAAPARDVIQRRSRPPADGPGEPDLSGLSDDEVDRRLRDLLAAERNGRPDGSPAGPNGTTADHAPNSARSPETRTTQP